MKPPFTPATALLEAPALLTGITALDKLIGGLRSGAPHLFYGDENPLSSALHTTTANAVKAGKKALIITTRDYHKGYILDTYELANALLQAGLDPEEGLRNVLVANIYNVRQVNVADKLVKLAARRNVGLVSVVYATELFNYRNYPALLTLLGKLKEILRTGAALTIFAARSPLSRRPLPDGPVFLRHFASAIVRVEDAGRGFARLVVEKGPCPTPYLLYALITPWGLADPEGWFQWDV